METPKTNDGLILFLELLRTGHRLSRQQIREMMWKHFGAQTDDDRTDVNRLVGLCAHFLGQGRLITTDTPIPKHTEYDEFEITAQGIRMAHLHASAKQLVTMSYVRELGGSKILRGDGSDFAKSWSEWEFLDYLEPLANDYTIFHSVSWFGRNGGTQGEIDFLIAHPQKGVLVLEVKGGIIRVHQEKNTLVWYSHRKNNPTSASPISPIYQAQRNSQALRDYLRYHPQTKHHHYAIFHAVAFPDSEVLEDISLNIPTDIILDMRHLGDVTERIDQIFAYHDAHRTKENKVMGGEDAVKALRSLILPTKTLEPRLSTIFAKERRKIEQFTERQKNILRILRYRPQATILGGAGTGKTLIAFEKALLLAQEGQKVLFLGYNKGLVDWAYRTLKHPNITIETLHSLVAKIMNWVGLGSEISKDHTEYNDTLTQSLHRSIEKLRQDDDLIEKQCFDALVIDEGQDFDTDQWMDLVRLLKRPVEGVLYVFADSNQRIFGEKEIGLIRLGEPLILDENCRNTAQIHEFAQQYSDTPTPNLLPREQNKEKLEGNPVKVINAQDTDAVYEQVSRLLHNLIDYHNIPAHEIVLLTPKSSKRTTIWKAETVLGTITVARDVQTAQNPERTVLVSTIQGYKGLECSVAILTEMTQCHPSKQNNLIYIALTRARHAVYVVGELPTPMK